MSGGFSLGSLKKGLASAMGVPEIKQKVLAATSNDQWGPTGTQMREVSDATHHYTEFGLIMETIWERMNDHGKNWRHVYKALLLLDYLLKNGADQCIREARVKLIEIRTLQEFQHIDEKDKDVGVSVRERAKAIVDLLQDDRRIAEERQKARENRGKYTTAISSDDRMGGYGGGGRSYASRAASGPPSYADDRDSYDGRNDRDSYDGRNDRYAGSSPVKPPLSHNTRPAPRRQEPQKQLDFSDDDYDDYAYDAPAAQPHPRAAAPKQAPAPAPAPLFDLLGDGPPATQAPAAVQSFPGQSSQFQPQYPPQTQQTQQLFAPATGFAPTGYSPAATASFPGFGTAAPAAAPGSFSFTSATFPAAAPPAAHGSMMFSPPAQPQPAHPTPAFFQPTPAATDSDWSDFQAAEKKPEAPKQPEKIIDKSDPWARSDLFSLAGKDDKASSQPAAKKEPMGASKPMGSAAPMGGMSSMGGMSHPASNNPFGMSTPQPQPGFAPGMAPGGYIMTPSGMVPAGGMPPGGYMMAPGTMPAGAYMMPQGAAAPAGYPPMGMMYGYPSG